MSNLIDSLSIQQCVNILKRAKPEQVRYGGLDDSIELDCIRAKCLKIIENAPEFTRESLNAPEAMYSDRTGLYLVRGLHSVLIQDEGDYYRATMPYNSSFYSECIYLKDIIEVTTIQNIEIEVTILN